MKRVDAHWDTSLFLDQFASLEDLPQAHCDYLRLREYVDIGFFAMFFDPEKIPVEHRYRAFSERMTLFLRDITRPETGIQLLLQASQVDQEGKFALISAEGGEFLGGPETAMERLEEAFGLGLRALGLTWNHSNVLAGGCGEGEGGNLTPLGEQVVARCNQLGILMDGAHLCDESLADLLRVSQKPVAVSHTCCTALCTKWQRRNLDDSQMRAVAEKGGVLGIAFVPDFLGENPGIPRIVEHIRHAVNIAGIDHVGTGSDFDGTVLPQDMQGLQSMPLLYEALKQGGFTEAEVEKIAGGNFCRLLREVLP